MAKRHGLVIYWLFYSANSGPLWLSEDSYWAEPFSLARVACLFCE